MFIDSSMEYVELGRSGLKVSVIGLGTWQFGTKLWGWGKDFGEEEAITTVHRALDLGMNLIDTAEIYGGGKSEEIIGKAIANRREEVFIATKVWSTNLTYNGIMKAVERSLSRLGVKTIDLYQVHWPNPFVPLEQTMKAMEKLVKEGKIRCIGVCNFSLNLLKRAMYALSSEEIVSNQVEYNLLNRKIEFELLPFAKKEKITIIAYSPLARGALTGKYLEKEIPRDLLRRFDPMYSPINKRRLRKVIEVLQRIGERRGKDASQVALNWLIKDSTVVAIPGAKRPSQVERNAGAAGWRLTEEEIKEIENAVKNFKVEKILSSIYMFFRAILP